MDIEKLAPSTFNKHRESVVIIDKRAIVPCDASKGKGFTIRSTDTTCLVMTCNHVIQGFDSSKHTLCIKFVGEAAEYSGEVLHQH
jgi:hypothetical protein